MTPTVWSVLLSDGTSLSGTTEDGSWKQLENKLNSSGLFVKSIKVYNDYGAISTDDNADGYFLGLKVVAHMIPLAQQEDYIGLGYWKKSDNKVRILWYDKRTLECKYNEARDAKDCGFFLVKNRNKIG